MDHNVFVNGFIAVYAHYKDNFTGAASESANRFI